MQDIIDRDTMIPQAIQIFSVAVLLHSCCWKEATAFAPSFVKRLSTSLQADPLEAILWDMDGVLADTERDGHRPAFNQAFQVSGIVLNHCVDAT